MIGSHVRVNSKSADSINLPGQNCLILTSWFISCCELSCIW